MRSVDLWGVKSRVEPEDRNVKDPYAIEIDQKMYCGALLKVGLEEDTFPLNPAEFHETLSGWDIHKTGLYSLGQKRRATKEECTRTLSDNTILAMPSGYQNN